MEMAVPPRNHWIILYLLSLNKTFVTVSSCSGSPRTGLRPRETCLVWLEDVFRLFQCLQYSRARQSNSSLPVRVPSCFDARELEIVRGIGGAGITLLAIHKYNTSTNLLKHFYNIFGN